MSVVVNNRFIALLLFIVILLPGATAFAEDTIVAKVGNVPITVFELNRQLQKIIPLSGSYHGGVSQDKIAELQTRALDQLIEQAYMVQYAFDEELAVPKKEIDAIYNPIVQRFDSEAAFEQALGGEGVDGIRASIFRVLLAQKALQVAVEDRIVVDPAALKAEFEQNKHRYVRPRQFRASHILIKVRPEMTAEEKQAKQKLADELYQRAAAGEDFYDLAYYNSEEKTKMVGGDIGLFHLGQAQPEVEEVIVKMKVGEISRPIRTFYGYEIIKLTEDTPETRMTFAELQEKLKSAKYQEQFDQLKAAWLEDLKQTYKVERFGKK